MLQANQLLENIILREQANQLLANIEAFIGEVENQKQFNEQWFLDFLDDLNELSVQY